MSVCVQGDVSRQFLLGQKLLWRSYSTKRILPSKLTQFSYHCVQWEHMLAKDWLSI